MRAVVSGNLRIVGLLLCRGMKLGSNALRFATEPAVAQLLIDRGANVNLSLCNDDVDSILRLVYFTGSTGGC